jgi:hypothetical protein
MTARGAVVLALPAAVTMLVAVVGCGDDGDARGAASPSSTPASSSARASGPTPSVSSPTASAPSGRAAPDLAGLRDCPGCQVRTVAANVRPGVSVALLVGPPAPVGQAGAFLTFRTGTGGRIDEHRIQAGDVFADAQGRPYQLVCDRLAHCLVPASVGVHSSVVTVVAVAPDGGIRLVTDRIGSEGPVSRAEDLDGDGVTEIVVIRNDGIPSFAEGSLFWQVYRWGGTGYASVGCARYGEGEARPPSELDPAFCPA